MKNSFSVLDGMRGIAAIFVVIIHTGAYWNNLDFHHSYLAVDTFFLLSGFVLTHAYKEKLQTYKISFNNFVIIRLIRLYPMFLASALLAGFAFWLKIDGNSTEHNWDIFQTLFLTLFFLPSNLLLNGVYLCP